MASLRKNEDLINIGAYAKGSDPEIDTAIKRREPMQKFLQQAIEEKADPTKLEPQLRGILAVTAAS
jgi:flagellum-specific ATP synthase